MLTVLLCDLVNTEIHLFSLFKAKIIYSSHHAFCLRVSFSYRETDALLFKFCQQLLIQIG